MAGEDTKTKLLDVAQGLIQSRGYNAFSFRDLAATVGIRTASIHYHFPSKADLGVALMQRYTSELDEALREIDASGGGAAERLEGFIELYGQTEHHQRICLCGSLAADRDTLPPELRDLVQRYLARSEAWAAATIAAGARDGVFDAEPGRAAALLVASLQGGLIVARGLDARDHIATLKDEFLRRLRPR